MRDVFVTQAQGKFFPWTRWRLKPEIMNKINNKEITAEQIKDEDWVVEVTRVQGQLRPVELWEYIFPEEHLDEVLSMFDIGQEGEVSPFTAKFAQKSMQKALGLKPIPKFNKAPTLNHVYREGVGLYPIGIKEDKKAVWIEQGIKQEML